MKLKGLFAIMAAALMLSMSFTSCEGLDGLFDDENESTDNQAFFPNTYRQRTVAAWYSLTEKEENGTRIEAVFLFDDNSFVTTKSRTYTDGRSQERKILAEGDYTLDGDYENGIAEVSINGAPEPMTIEIKDGKMLAMGETFTKQSNKKVPKPSEESEGGDGDGGHGQQGGQGDGGQGDGLEAFFPNGFSSKDVASWYAQSGTVSEQGYEMQYNAAIFFFANGQFVATAHSVITGPDGPIPTKAIAIKGSYEWVGEGNFDNGKLKLIGDDGKVIVVDIADGKLTGIETEDGQVTIYSKQDNKSVPQSSDPTENGQQGGEGEGGEGEGGEGQGGEDQGNEVPAFFPKAYAEKTVVAWYSFSEGEKGETRVEAVFLLEDNIVIVTENKVFGEEVGMNPERYIKDTGSYKLREGDYETGLGIVELKEMGQHQVKIANGVLTVDGLYGEYAKRALADIPDPLDPTDLGQQGGEGEGQGEGGEGQGGEDEGGQGQSGEDDGGEGGEVQYNGDPTPYLPAQYGSKTIAAWYQYDNVGNGTVTYECVFLFTDGTLVVTKSKFYNIGDGRGPEYGINATGQYRMSEGGDFENGTASVVTADGKTMEVRIENGILYAMNTEFTKQDNKDAPAPIKK